MIQKVEAGKLKWLVIGIMVWLMALPSITIAQLQPGDTLEYQAHDTTVVGWYGNYDQWVNLPEDTTPIREISLNYTLGCEDGDCGFEAYPIRLQALKPTGKHDTIKQIQPTFMVNGLLVDTLAFRFTPTYQYHFDSANYRTDSVKTDSLQVVRYNDSANPTIPTDTLHVWPAGYHNPVFDSLGRQIGQKYVEPDTVWTIDHHVYHEIEEVFKLYELGRIQTPFGGSSDSGNTVFDADWSHTYQFDVSDFSKILRDSVIIRLRNEGWQSGFSNSVSLKFTVGTPNKQIHSIKNLYQGSAEYQDQDHFKSRFKPLEIQIPKKADAAKLRFIISGHGSQNDQQCGAFCKKRYFVNIDQQQVVNKTIWRQDCGMNPIFPQTGNWVENRANWCPGMKTGIHEHVLGEQWLDGRQHSLDLDFQSIQWEGEQAPYYHITAQLISYDSLPKNDVGVQEILAPSDKDEFARRNPVALHPIIRVKNGGMNALTAFDIKYGTNGDSLLVHKWTGNLAPQQTQLIRLPAKADWRKGGNKFHVKLEHPNGDEDLYLSNNEATSYFQRPDELPNQFVLHFRSNFQAEENRIEIRNAQGTVQYEKSEFTASALYRDTVNLAGKGERFRLVLSDEGGDGLFYPLNNAGKGAISLLPVGDTGNLKTFPANFGDSLTYEFQATKTTTSHAEKPKNKDANFRLYPNPAKANVHVEGEDLADTKVQVQLINAMGKKVKERTFLNSGPSIKMSIKSLEPGIYILRLQTSDREFMEKLLVR